VISNPGQFTGIYDIGGPEHLSYREIVETLSHSMGHIRPSLKIPMGLMKLAASFLESVLPSPPVTSDQLRLLEQDNICDLDTIKKNFGFEPMTYRDALKEFIKG
jgi:NADH dehydrogenase